MISFFKSINLFVIIFHLVTAHVPLTQKPENFWESDRNEKSAHISPELLNELKDFKNLIPETTIDEIVAEHLLLDGNFRKALKYLRSQEFDQLQKQLLNIPEIIDVLEFLHLTAENTTTTTQMGATKMPTTNTRFIPSLDEFSDGAVTDSYKRIVKMTTNTGGSIITKPQTMTFDNGKEELVSKLKSPKTPQKQFYIKEKSNKFVGLDNDDYEDNDDAKDDDDETVNANSIAFNEEQPLVHIVLLDDLEVKAKVSNKGKQHNHYYHKDKRQRYNSYQHSSLGTFTSFVEEVLQHLPNSAYQNMITDKCTKNAKFAQFYHALRSPALKPFIEQIKTKPNIQQIIATFNSHDVDINSLEPIAFKVISWGPSI